MLTNAYSAGSVIQDKELEFTKSLYSLQQQPKFNLMLFENEIDKIRLCVAEVSISWFILVYSHDPGWAYY